MLLNASEATREAASSRRVVSIHAVLCGLVAVAAVAGTLALSPAIASAESLCTDTWTGPAEGSWRTAEDWSAGKVPSSTDVACIGSGKTVKVTEGTNQAGVVQGAGTLVISGGSLEVSSALEVSSIARLSVVGGTLKAAAEVGVTSSFVGGEDGWIEGSSESVVIKSGATGTVSPVDGTHLNIERATLKNEGSLTVGKSSGISGSGHAKLINDGTLTVNGETGAEGHGLVASRGEATLTNTGTVQKTEGTGTTQVGFTVANEGAISVSSGKLEFTAGGTSSEHGTYSASGAGAGLVFEVGGETFALGTASLSSSGSIEVTNGTVIATKIEGSSGGVTLAGSGSAQGTLELIGASASTVQDLTVEDGRLTGTGEIDVTSAFTGGANGSFHGSGSTVLEAGATGTILAKAIGTSFWLERWTVKNSGTLTVGSGSGIQGEKRAHLINTGTLIVNGETKEASHGLIVGGEGAVLTNLGTIKKTEGTGETPIEFEFENLGAIKEETGYFKIYHPVFARESSSEYGGSENPSAPSEPHPTCGDPVSCATGNFSETQTDFAIGGRGVGLYLARTYNSQAAAEGVKGAFGYGWTSSFSDHLVVNKEAKRTTLHQANGSTVAFTEEGGGSFKAPVWTQDTLGGTEGSGYTLTLAGQIKYKFAGATGRLESVTDRDGNATTLTYNEAGQLTTITDPVSRTMKLAYNGEGLVESAEDPMKHVVKYTYEGGNLKSITQPAEESLRWQFKYDGSHRMTEMTNGRGGKTINEYNGSSQVTKQEDPAGHKLKFEYEPFHTKITNENTSSITNEYFTSNDEPASITRGFGTSSASTESFAYSEAGYVTSVTDGNGHTTQYGYNAANDRTSMIDPNKNETKWTYDSTHDVETMTTPKGETTTIKRDSHGNAEIDRTARSGKQNPDHEIQIQDHRRTRKHGRPTQTHLEIRIQCQR